MSEVTKFVGAGESKEALANAYGAGGDGPWLQGDVASAPLGEVLAAFSPQLSRPLDLRRHQTTTINKMQKQLAMHQQLQANNADYACQTGFHRGCDIDFLGPYDAFSTHSLLHGNADEWSEEEELYSWD